MKTSRFFIISGILIFILTFLVYFNTLDGFFTSDDYGPLGFVKDASFIDMFRANMPQKGNEFIRPVSDFFWKWDYLIWHFNPMGYHITNTTLHALTSILVTILSFLLIKNKLISLFAGILFAVHPIHLETVVRLADRYDLLCALFYLLSLVAFIIYSNGVFKKKYLYIASIIFYPLAILSKEAGVTLPVTLMIYSFVFKPRKKIKLYIPYFTIMFIYLALRFSYIGDVGGYRNFAGKPLFLEFNFMSFIKRMLYNIPTYLVLSMHREVIRQQIQILIAVIFFIGIVLALYFNWRYINKSLLFFSLAFIAINLLPVHNMVGVGPDLQGARLMYLPAVGFCIIFAHFLLAGEKGGSILRSLNLNIISIFCLSYIFLSFNDSQPWNIAGRVTAQIPKIVKDYAQRLPQGGKFYFFIPDTIKGAYPYGHYIPETLAPILLPVKPEDMVVISDVNYGDTGEYRFYDFDLRQNDFRANLSKKKIYCFKWNDASGLLEDITLSLNSKLTNLKPDAVLPKVYHLEDSASVIKNMHIPVKSIATIELKIRIKTPKPTRDRLEIFWISSNDKRWDLSKHIYFPVDVDGEFHIYQIPFYLFNPDWLREDAYMEELEFQLNTHSSKSLEIEYIRLLPCR